MSKMLERELVDAIESFRRRHPRLRVRDVTRALTFIASALFKGQYK